MVMMLSVMMILTMMPSFAFADDEPANDPQNYDLQNVEGDNDTDPAEGGVTGGSGGVDNNDLEEPVVTEGPGSEEPDPENPAAAPADELQKGVTDPPVEKGDGEGEPEPDPDPVCPPHSMEAHPATAATCTTDGNTAYWQCTLCQKYFSDEEGNTEILEDSWKIAIDPNAHKWDGGKITTPPAPNKNGVKTYTCTLCGKTRTETVVPVGKSYTIDGKSLQFSSNIVQMAPSFMKGSKVDHVWLKAAKKSMKVSWSNPSNKKYVTGIIILRKDGKEKVYKEVGRVKYGTTSFNDKKAKKKNKPYNYIAVAYYTKDGYTYISHVSDWAAGQTSASKKKTVTKAKINKKSASLEYGGSVKLTVKYSKPKSTYNAKSFRWYSDNPKVATVSKGKVVAKAPGTTYIRCRLSSGKDITCKVSVTGAFKPATPTLKVDVADESSITLVWNSVKYADNYIIHQSEDGTHWNKSYTVTGTSRKVTGLKKGTLYYFYIVAQNVNGPYKALSGNSKVISQKAVEKLRPTSVSGFPSSKSAKVGSTIKISVKVTAPEGRTASLQMQSGSSWTTKKSVKLPAGTGTSSVSITFPSDWESGNTKWRLYIPKNSTASEYTTGTLTITAQRAYQNPSSYVQIQDKISDHGKGYYISPIMVNNKSSKSDHVEALIKTAGKYKGTAYSKGKAGAPGKGIDTSGLVIQACYGAGVDLWPVCPTSNSITGVNNAKLKSISVDQSDPLNNLTRGDLIFYKNKDKTYVCVAIYLGNGNQVLADPVKGSVTNTDVSMMIDPTGKYKYTIGGVKRIFN